MNTDQLIEHSRARFEHSQARRLLKEKYQAKLVFAHAGGMFRATPEMITFLSMYDSQDIVIKDLYETPVKVNAEKLVTEMKARWQEQMSAWLIEHESLSRKR